MKLTVASSTFTVLALTFAFAPPNAGASVVYSFSGFTANIGPYVAEPVSFELTEPDASVLTGAGFPGITLGCSTLTACVNIGTVRFFSNFSGIDGFQLNPSNQNAGFGYFFDAGSFGKNGTYVSGGNPGTLTVSGIAAAVPEAQSWGLMLAGLSVVAAAGRRRRQWPSHWRCLR